MSLRTKLLGALSLILLLGFSSVKTTFASSYNLTGTISDSFNNVIGGASVSVSDANTGANTGATTSDGAGHYSILLMGGTYNTQVTPPAGTNFSPITAFSQSITSDTVLNFVFAPAGQVSLTGHLYDEYGNPLPNQTVYLSSSHTTSDSSGYYSFSSYTPGTYDIEVDGGNNNGTLNEPSQYQYRIFNYSLSQSSIQDITIPGRKVSVHVQDPSGSPVANSNVTANRPSAYYYPYDSDSSQTDSSGNAVVWTFDGSDITVSPPSGSSLKAVTLLKVSIPNDSTKTITLTSPINLSGYLRDEYGNPLPNQQMHINTSTGVYYNTTSDSSGYYSFSSVASGIYDVEIVGGNNGGTTNEPSQYDYRFFSYSLTQTTTQDFSIPARKVTVHVQDPSGNPVSNASVTANRPSAYYYPYDNDSSTTNSSGDAIVWTFDGSDITASPPSGSTLKDVTLLKVSIPSDMTQTITLTAPINYSGHLYDEYNNPLPNQPVHISTSTGLYYNSTSDASGYFSFSSIQSGTYDIEVNGGNNGGTLNEPSQFDIRFFSYSITQTSTQDFTIPGRKVTVHVQDPAGSPVSNASVTANRPSAYYYPYDNDSSQTDNSGNAVVWTFDGSDIIVSPPSGSIYTPVALLKVSIPSDQTEVISLQFKNQPSVVNQISNATVNEGGTYTTSGSFFDPDSTSWTGKVDYGDGSGEHVFASPNESIDQSNHTITINHVYKDNGVYTVTVKITDNQGAVGTGTATVTVNNVAPSVVAITAPTSLVLVNTLMTASASFTDPGVNDTHTASWNWGDGNTTTGTVTESNGSGSVSDDHTYSTAGVYTITLTVTDNNSGVGTSVFQYLSVYSPTPQGLFTAGQKYTSPAGAYLDNPNSTGYVMFGLSYKYQGAVPVGNRQFTMDFKTANFEFNATTIFSLVITNGVATLRGSGTITNRSGVYDFLVVGKESADTVRIKITDTSNNNAVIYDTQLGASDTATPATAVTAGNVLAH